MTRKRGPYDGMKKKELKIRVSRQTYQEIQRLADHRESAVAVVVRNLVLKGLEDLQHAKVQG